MNTNESWDHVVNELLKIKEYSVMDFHSELRRRLNNCNEDTFEMFHTLVWEFQDPILQNGIFYIEIINFKLSLYIQMVLKKKADIDMVYKLIRTIEGIEVIGNMRMYRMIKHFRHHLSSTYVVEKERMQVVENFILNNIRSMEERIHNSIMHREQDFIVQWF